MVVHWPHWSWMGPMARPSGMWKKSVPEVRSGGPRLSAVYEKVAPESPPAGIDEGETVADVNSVSVQVWS